MQEFGLTLSAEEVAKRLGFGISLTYRLLKAGVIPSVRIGIKPKYRVPVKVLEDLLADPERFSLALAEERERSVAHA